MPGFSTGRDWTNYDEISPDEAYALLGEGNGTEFIATRCKAVDD